MTTPPPFSSIDYPYPDWQSLMAQVEGLIETIGTTDRAEDALDAMAKYEHLMQGLDSNGALTYLRFSQDTSSEAHKARKANYDEMAPKFEDYTNRLKQAFLDSPHAEALKANFGEHVLNLWRVDIETFQPSIEPLLVEESKIKTRYVELTAGAQIEFQGETYTISELKKFANHADRNVRREAARVQWQWVYDNEEALDTIYDELVAVRHKIATMLGHDQFTPLGYKRMKRTDYNEEDVARFRQEVRDVVVPLAQQLREAQRQALGVDTLYAWDEGVHDLNGNPAPQGDHDWMVEQARAMFNEMGHGLGKFFGQMADGGYMDLKSRKNKAGGGFCTSIADVKMPFIFANFNGTKGDVEVFTHEMGHAFQNWCSSDKDILEYHWPTSESAEIHSMSLEFLTWPHMEKFFLDDADRFRRIHLIEGLLFLPYGVAVDHFQHMVYAEPEASAERRRQMWAQCEQMYMPWRNWGELDEVASGRRWQLQGHIYQVPFYYIDYTLAQTCALQFWLRAEADFETAMEDYVTLCKRGGEAPFLELVSSAKLRSPFEPGSLEAVVERSRAFLEQ